MRSIRTLILASVFALPASGAFAQMYPGQGITVNPWAIGAAPNHYGMAPIHLHMPVHRRVVHHHPAVAAATPPAPAAQTADTSKPAPAAAPPADTSQPAASPMIGTMADSVQQPAPLPPAPAKPAKKPAPTKTAAASPPPAATAPAADNSGSFDSAIPFSLDGVHNAPAAKPGPQKPAAKPAPTQTASVQPPPANVAPQPAASQPGMTKRGEILFTKNATDPAPAQFDGLKLLAGDLSEALKNGSSRIQLEAYGGNHGDKSSDARRLSLKRALSIRQVLIDNGVPANTIDVRAMGGASDSGPNDRVDVYVRAS